MAHNKGTHVLMVSLFYQGHMNPMIRFAKLLTLKGLQVTLATTNHARDHLSTRLASQTNFIEFEFFDDGFDSEIDREKNLGIILEDYLPTNGAKNLSNLIYSLETKGKIFASIVVNCFVPWVTNVAITHSIPCSMLWIQSCATYGIYYHFQKSPSLFSSLDDPNSIFDIPGMPLLKTQDLPTFILPSSPLHFRNVITKTMNVLDQFQWIFGSSFYDLEETLVKTMLQFKPITSIGPLVSPTMLRVGDSQDEDKEEERNDICINWLDKQGTSSVIYIALGSISVLSQNETNAIAMTLEGDNNNRFLWVRKEGGTSSGKEIGELSKTFVENTKDRGLIVPWCCQEKVLMHPAIKCFLTHCGWNSTLETITAGVPVVAYPDWTDQPTNAKLLVDVFKVGVRMVKNSDGTLEREEVERCLMEVSEGPRALAMKEQAIKWKEAAIKATSRGGSSYMNIESFVNELRDKIIG